MNSFVRKANAAFLGLLATTASGLLLTNQRKATAGPMGCPNDTGQSLGTTPLTQSGSWAECQGSVTTGGTTYCCDYNWHHYYNGAVYVTTKGWLFAENPDRICGVIPGSPPGVTQRACLPDPNSRSY